MDPEYGFLSLMCTLNLMRQILGFNNHLKNFVFFFTKPGIVMR